MSYKGTVAENPQKLGFDKGIEFTRDEKLPVSRNTWLSLQNSRYKSHFEFYGEAKVHAGMFTSTSGEFPFDLSKSDPSGCC